jgi:uncharacterized DUF497 family protein
MVTDFSDFDGFQWDNGNTDKNLMKHNVYNWESEQMFFNKPLLVLDDSKHSQKEKRWAAFGKSDTGRFLVVVFTKRGRLVGIISARDMNRRERRFYEENK